MINKEISILKVKNRAIRELLERVEYDLLCVVYLSRSGVFSVSSPENIVYLLLQSIEKWLKVVIYFYQNNLLKEYHHHNLEMLLVKTGNYHPSFSHIWQILAEENKLLEESYGINIRYQALDSAENDLHFWFDAAFTTRRISKKWINNFVKTKIKEVN